MSAPPPRVRHVADGSLLVEYPDSADEEANGAAVGLAAFLRKTAPEGLHDAIVGARTLFCAFEPRRLAHDALARLIESAPPAGTGETPPHAREHRIAVLYGGEAGADLPALARRARLSEEEVVRRHAGAAYRVAFLGFAPGFAYLTGLPSVLAAPRLATPRPRVAAGTLALAGPYSGVYPAQSPGGWNLIGRAAARLFDPAADPPTLLAPGDRVSFDPQTPSDFARSLAALSLPAASPSPAPAPAPSATPLFRITSPGLWSAVCGAPIPGRGMFGVPPSGAMDTEALAAGNTLVGNTFGADALEVSVAGPQLEALAEATAVLSGAPCDATLDARAVPVGAPFRVPKGSKLVIGQVRSGMRSYVCVAGGLASGARLDLPGRLTSGDLVFSAPPTDGRRRDAPSRPGISFLPGEEPVVRIVLGPQEDVFSDEGVADLVRLPYRVSSTSDRRGIRLEGRPLAFRGKTDIPPEGTALGAIQVPADGQPIVLGPDRPVTGGYAKIATVIGADFPLLAQARPGTMLRFRAVSLAEALEARGRMARP